MSKSLLYTLFFLFCLLGAWVLFSEPDGLVVKMKIHKNNCEFRNIYYIKKEKFKVVSEDKTLIFADGMLSLLDTRNRLYWNGGRNEFNKTMIDLILSSDTQNTVRNKYFFRSLKEKDHKSVKEAVKGVSGKHDVKGIQPEIKITPNYKSIAGFASRKYQIKQNGLVVEEVWIAENLKNYINYDLNLDLYNDYMESLLQHTESKLYFHLGSFMEIIENGFPMKIVMYGGGTVTETEVESLIKTKLDDSFFEVADTYQQVELTQLLK